MILLKLHKWTYPLLFVCFLLPLSSTAQNALQEFSYRPNWDFGITAGVSAYQGDVANFMQPTDFQYFAGATARIQWSPYFFGRINALYGKLQGKDANFTSQSWRQQRAFSFSSPIGELSAAFEYSPFGDLRNIGNETYRPRRLVPYIFVGAGVVYTKVETDFNVVKDNNPITPLEKIREDQNAKTTNYRLVAPIGGGIRINLSAKTMLGFEIGLRPTFNDYLDGISQAGNPNKKDWYALSGISLSQRFGAVQK